MDVRNRWWEITDASIIPAVHTPGNCQLVILNKPLLTNSFLISTLTANPSEPSQKGQFLRHQHWRSYANAFLYTWGEVFFFKTYRT